MVGQGQRAGAGRGSGGPIGGRWAVWAVRHLGVIALVAACAGRSSERTPWRSTKGTGNELEVSRRVLDHVNRERSAVGLPPLAWESNASAVASAYALEMLEMKTIGGVPESEGAADRVFVAKADDLTALQHVAHVRELDEVSRGLLASPEAHAALLSASASELGIGIRFGPEVSGRHKIYMTVLVRARSDGEVMTAAEARAADGVPVPPPAPSTPPPPPVVPPRLLEGWRISGSPAIVPDDRTKLVIANAGLRKVIGSFKLCIAADGKVASVDRIKTTRLPAYDAKIMRQMRSWKYRPYEVDGKPVPVCTVVSFVYSQR